MLFWHKRRSAAKVTYFKEVEVAERKAILKRRDLTYDAEKCKPGEINDEDKPGEISDLAGVSLSGGGIRSASFCLGALQALDKFNLIKRVDYLSTVSGGGYIGASMIAAMTRSEGSFPFSELQGNALKDSAEVSHIRDHSRYLMPHGFDDILKSSGMLFRGLVVNIILVLTIILPLATLTILTNPTVPHLRYSFVADVWNFYFESNDSSVYDFLHDRFFLTKATLAASFVFLTFWGIKCSFQEKGARRNARLQPEYESRFATLTKWGLIFFLVALVAESQTYAIEWLIAFTHSQSKIADKNVVLTVFAALISAASTVAAFRQKFVNIIANAIDTPTVGAMLTVVTARLTIYAAALVIPATVYFAFLWIAASGIAAECLPRECSRAEAYPLLPEGFLTLEPVLFRTFLILLFVSITYAVIQMWGSWSFFVMIFHKIRNEKRRTFIRLVVAVLYAFILYRIMIATRSNGPGYYEALYCFTWMTGIAMVLGMTFSENANALHGLYRDRLNTAFRLGRGAEGTRSMPLADINTDSAPYLLVNTTLNARRFGEEELKHEKIQRDHEEQLSRPQSILAKFTQAAIRLLGHAPDTVASTSSAEKGTASYQTRFDPAARGRRAEFFLFSKAFVGSDATGYVSSSEYDTTDRYVDLATAVAISGAAVSSNSGRIGTPVMSPTLALLNLRLGYWLDNPRFISGLSTQIAKWTEIFSLYLLQEAFGLLRTSSRKVLLSDGGHIDNIGLYQLLKRKCKVIIVVDAEADPAMNFGALADAQRFARIDLGHRVSIDWAPMRAQANARNANRLATVPRSDPSHKQHFAVGKIQYDNPDGSIKEGILLYIKANVTGDEPDYVLDYERRYPTFPHETTADQFFTEEQMEAYRALGFHSVCRALAGVEKTDPIETYEAIATLRASLGLGILDE